MGSERDFLKAMDAFRRLPLNEVISEATHAEFGTMMSIHENSNKCQGKARISDVIRDICVSAPAVSRTITVLEKKGWVIRSVDLEDRRNTYVELTEEGRRQMQSAQKQLQNFMHVVSRKMGESSMTELTRLMNLLCEVAREELVTIKKGKSEV